MNRPIFKVLSLCAAVFTISYVGVMAYRYSYTPYKTETAFTYSMDDSYTLPGALIRSEIVIPGEPGVLNYRVKNGDMVLKGTVVADVFARDSDIVQQKKIAALETEIENLRSAQHAAYSGINTVNVINGQIEDQLESATLNAAYGDLSGLAERVQALTYHFNRKQVAVGREKDYTARTEYLNNEISFLLRNASAAQGAVVSPAIGYFSSVTDGFEAQFSYGNIGELDDKAVADLIMGRLSSVGSAGAGKIVTTHNYYLAVIAGEDIAGRFVEGARLHLEFPSDTALDISARVVQSRPLEDGKYIVYLRLSNVNDYLLAQRRASVTVKFDTITGLRLPASAVRYVGPQAGTYVLHNGRIIFKPIEIVHEEAGHVLCKPANVTDSSPLKMYDQVIVSGTDLYDGKVVG